MPSNDTPPRPFVPKTEAERESVKALAAETAIETVRLMNGDVYNETIEMAHSLAQKIVPKLPRVKRRVEFMRSTGKPAVPFEWHDPVFVVIGMNGTPYEYEPKTFLATYTDNVIDQITVLPLMADLLANPDMPAAPPAAAQGGVKVPEWCAKKNTDELLQTLAKAWPVLADHAPHMDGSFNAAHTTLKNVVAELQGIASQTPRADASPNVTVRMDGALLGAVPVGRALTEDEYGECWRLSYAVNGAADSARVIIEEADRIRGLAPTVTP